jgi:hypothetical protein
VGWSGLVYAAIVVGWAAYLIPHALRRHEEAAADRSIDGFSSAMRVLGRGRTDEPVPEVAAIPPSRDQIRTQRAAQRRAARVAAKRRRRVLLLFLTATAATIGTAAYGFVPRWSVAMPGGLTVAFLWACSRRVRREAENYWSTAPAVSDRPPRDPEDDEPTVVLDRAEIAQMALTMQASDGSTLWDPVPVTLPTYVSKPKAPRTIRTIDLGQPDTWTSGNTDEATALAEQAGEPTKDEASEPEEEAPRAVGS